MTLSTILFFSIGAFVYNLIRSQVWRAWTLFVLSVFAVYVLQPRLSIRFADFILPTVALVITVTSWWFTRGEDQSLQSNLFTLLILIGLIIGMAMMRFIDADYRLTPSRPPSPWMVFIGLMITCLLVIVLTRLFKPQHQINLMLLGIIVLFVVLKSEFLASAISKWWRGQTAQDVTLASSLDLSWLGFSYIAFRLIHTLRDYQTGKLPAVSLREYLTYVMFFPSLIAGPIDRVERFIKDYRTLSSDFEAGLHRITVGIFKKFIIADSLTYGLSLDSIDIGQIQNTTGYWILLYGYAFRLFFDFSGYTDIAIGIGLLFGVRLPENFNRPYLQTNITAFWQSWHITLSNWVRFYVFAPFSRWMLKHSIKRSPVVIVFAAQLLTMIIIGLWHGITLNFFIWGVWHGVGLFIHKQWTDRTRKWYRSLSLRQNQLIAFGAWLITFHYVVIGWVWFALPDVNESWRVLVGLFGF
ncbi:MAG: hypothetical protein Kow00117_12050 [Phototrophicales bacterium]